jgi:predicted dithiol-disulfide oxidoreductase (DUF899 family)
MQATGPEDAMAERHPIVSREQWLAARRELLAKEKAFTRARDELNRARRELPWERVEKRYEFEGPDGRASLSDLFAGQSQLIVQHFMFGPAWEAGCPHCSFWADSFDRIPIHLAHRDISFVAVSRAPYPKIAAYRQRMGWSFRWLSSFGSDFNYDYCVSFTPEQLAAGRALYNFVEQNPGMEEREGVSVFFKDAAGELFHTYSSYSRGLDLLNSAYNYIDLAPKGRDEPAQGNPQFWVRRRDEYDR